MIQVKRGRKRKNDKEKNIDQGLSKTQSEFKKIILQCKNEKQKNKILVEKLNLTDSEFKQINSKNTEKFKIIKNNLKEIKKTTENVKELISNYIEKKNNIKIQQEIKKKKINIKEEEEELEVLEEGFIGNNIKNETLKSYNIDNVSSNNNEDNEINNKKLQMMEENIIENLIQLSSLNEKIYQNVNKKMQNLINQIDKANKDNDLILKSLQDFMEESLEQYDQLKPLQNSNLSFDRRNLGSDIEKVILENANAVNNDARLYLSAFSYNNNLKDNIKRKRKHPSMFLNLKKKK